MARRDGGEDSVQILQLQAYESDRGKGETPERLLNFFVRVVAFIERLGNGLGMLAFTWATVILLGGYPTKLSQRKDFVYTTAIVFLEAARMFIRSNNKLDYQLFFHTKGAVKPLGWNGLIIIIPAAVTRVVLAALGLVPHNYLSGPPADGGDTINLKPSLDIFYGMVLAQGILYVMACVLEIFSFIPRKCLARHSIFRCKWGVESINAYYKYAMEKSIEGDAFSTKKISLNSFAMYRLNSDTPKMQLDGIRIIHCLLQREQTRTLLLQELNASMDTMAILIRMLDKTRQEDTTIRLFAAKVIAEMSKDLRVVTVPAGTMQLISALLDANSKPKRGSALLDTDDDDDEQEKKQYRVTESTNIHEQRHASVVDVDDNNLQETQACSSQQVDSDDQNCCSLGCWKWILTCWSSPTEKPLTPYDHLPVLGMSILDSLACDYDNCVEISRVVGLIPKIIGFTSYINGKENTNYVQQKILMESSLKLLRRLSNTGGEIGITLRRKVVDTIMDIETDVTELEALIGLSSQTCRVNPEEFAQELKNGHREETFVKSLINTLNENMNPAVHCPGIRRVTIEQAIYLMDYNPYYATLFNKYNMMDALVMVEQTPSSVERYKIFLGDVGFMEHKEPLSNLVSRAKRLMRR
ncbi:hypothetical protein PR202_gb21872 [Eleusine coracana subsp. coracana]|uniref:Uncharacterized protein n=1 Tax=Eleusine coracana subsp. coracana TaxID=191504 RepID=A0AAV5FE94_ELECO|nr:hypothetical protein PR202_gb21872 [Eleusine coracana subsp. coracana]